MEIALTLVSCFRPLKYAVRSMRIPFMARPFQVAALYYLCSNTKVRQTSVNSWGCTIAVQYYTHYTLQTFGAAQRYTMHTQHYAQHYAQRLTLVRVV
jgi:hypothetical protein